MGEKKFIARHQIRGYELDGYGHVNHAVYLNIAEYARWCMIEEATGGVQYFQDQGVAPVVARLEVDYRKPCFLGQWVRIETTLDSHRSKSALFRHRIIRESDEALAAELLVTIIPVNQAGRAAALPADFLKFFGVESLPQK